MEYNTKLLLIYTELQVYCVYYYSFICPSVSICQYISQYICQNVCQYICLSVYQSVYVSISVSTSVSRAGVKRGTEYQTERNTEGKTERNTECMAVMSLIFDDEINLISDDDEINLISDDEIHLSDDNGELMDYELIDYDQVI